MRISAGFVFVAVAVSVCVLPALAATAPGEASSGSESLGGALIDDLVPDPVVPRGPVSPDAAPRGPASAGTGATPDESKGFDDLRGFGAATPESTALGRVRQTMKRAEGLLSERERAARLQAVEQAGEVQAEVIAELDKLIAELSKQCKGQSGQSGEKDEPESQRSQAKAGKPGQAAGRGTTAARDSSDRLDGGSQATVEKADVEALVKELWGHLPKRAQEQMIQSFSDEFLPKYELEIEKYYQRLGEEQPGEAAR